MSEAPQANNSVPVKGEKFAEVAPALPLSPTSNQTYTYRLARNTQTAITKFSTVTIPFGKRQIPGVVTKLHGITPKYPTKTITHLNPAVLTPPQVAFAKWISSTMQGGFGYTLRLFNPPGKRWQPIRSKHNKISHKPSRKAQDIRRDLLTNPVALLGSNITKRHRILSDLITWQAAQGHQTLTIVPEKNLLPGPGMAYSADLPTKQATSIWHSVKNNDINAVRGTQKAFFLPFNQLGLIIVEEEQYQTHKLWDAYPRLHNIDAARALANIHHCPILYTSSFPSLRLWKAIQDQQITSFGSWRQARTQIIKHSFNDKLYKNAIPYQLIQSIKKWTSQKQQVLLFYNQLDTRSIRHNLHKHLSKSAQRLCHLTTSAVFSAVQTQPYNKVVWLYPEQALSYPDYRSTEHNLIYLSRLQQLTQRSSTIYIATKQPEKIAQLFASPIEEIYQQELLSRQPLRLPPFADQVKLTVVAQKKPQADKKAQDLVDQIEEKITAANHTDITIRGPYSALKADQGPPYKKFIILRGPLSALTPLYNGLPIDSADLSPANII